MSKMLKQQTISRPWRILDPLQLTNVEVSHAIVQKVNVFDGIYIFDALTSEGWLRTLSMDVSEEDRNRVLEHIARSPMVHIGWGKPRATRVVSFRPTSSALLADASVDSQSTLEPTPDPCTDWTDSPESILTTLENSRASTRERDAAVLFAGAIAFSDEQRPRLLGALADYINEHRFARDDDRITVVGSAARKYAMNMNERDFERYAQWLAPEQTEYLSSRVELELVKGICWRLLFEPLLIKGEFPTLARTLVDIATGYTTARFLLQENFAAIALNAIVSVIVLDAMARRGDFTREVWSQVRRAKRDWFTEMVQRRLCDAFVAIREHDAELFGSVRDLVANAWTIEGLADAGEKAN